MAERRAWVVISIAVAVLVVASVLFSTPSMIFARKVAIIDTELREMGGDARFVLTKMDLGDEAQLRSIPHDLGAWEMEEERDWDRVAEILNSDVLLSREYARADLYQTVNLLVVESTNVSSFHPAPVCYRVQGWSVPEDGGATVSVPVPNATWAQASWLGEGEPYVFAGNLSAKLLSVTKTRPDGSEEQRVALYAYLKREDWRTTREVTWIRTEIEVPAGTDPLDVAPVLGSLFAETVPHIFSLREGQEKMVWEMLAGR